MEHPSIDGLVNPGEDLLGGIADLARHRGVSRGMALLMGALDGATVRPAPDATPLILTRATWLVQATASIDAGQVALHGVISWDDQGIPRVAAGLIEAARSGGVRMQLLPTALGAAAPAPAPPAKPAPKRAKAKPARQTARDAQIDLRDEVPEIAAQPKSWGAAVAASKAEPAPAPATAKKSAGGWGAAVAASRSASPAPPKKSGGGSGWGAAVAASKGGASSRRSGRPSPDELGFDAPPTLVAGDVLLHPRFGRCVVSRMVGKTKVKLRRPSGGLFDLQLRVCNFVREPDEDGKRVFSVTIGR